jgi:hypothetical protein
MFQDPQPNPRSCSSARGLELSEPRIRVSCQGENLMVPPVRNDLPRVGTAQSTGSSREGPKEDKTEALSGHGEGGLSNDIGSIILMGPLTLICRM